MYKFDFMNYSYCVTNNIHNFYINGSKYVLIHVLSYGIMREDTFY